MAKSYPRMRTPETKLIEKLLKEHFPGYPPEHPPKAYYYNPASIRVRLVHDMFKGKNRSDREDIVLPVIHMLPEEIQQDLMILLLLPPEELKRSVANFEFEHPTPPRL